MAILNISLFIRYNSSLDGGGIFVDLREGKVANNSNSISIPDIFSISGGGVVGGFDGQGLFVVVDSLIVYSDGNRERQLIVLN